jgi:hypothetical protein
MNANELPTRPGIRAETLRAANIRISDKPEPGSIEIPYHDMNGNLTGFLRWRLPRERANGQKYHQEVDTGTRAYIPPQFTSFRPGGDMVIVEGEFKALSLIDAGIKAIGLPSFNTYAVDESGEQQLLAGIAHVRVNELFAKVMVWNVGGAGGTKTGAVASSNPIPTVPTKWFGLKSSTVEAPGATCLKSKRICV